MVAAATVRYGIPMLKDWLARYLPSAPTVLDFTCATSTGKQDALIYRDVALHGTLVVKSKADFPIFVAWVQLRYSLTGGRPGLIALPVLSYIEPLQSINVPVQFDVHWLDAPQRTPYADLEILLVETRGPWKENVHRNFAGKFPKVELQYA